MANINPVTMTANTAKKKMISTTELIAIGIMMLPESFGDRVGIVPVAKTSGTVIAQTILIV